MLAKNTFKQKVAISTEKTFFLRVKKGVIGIRTYRFNERDMLLSIINHMISNNLKSSLIFHNKDFFIRIFVKNNSIESVTTILDGIEYTLPELSNRRITGYEIEYQFLSLFMQALVENYETWGVFKNGLNETVLSSVWNISIHELLFLLEKEFIKNIDFFYSASIIPSKEKEKNKPHMFNTNLFSIFTKENEKVKLLSLIRKIENYLERGGKKQVFSVLSPEKFYKWRSNLATGFYREQLSSFELSDLKKLVELSLKQVNETQNKTKTDSVYYPPESNFNNNEYVLFTNEKTSISNDEIGIQRSSIDLNNIPRPSIRASNNTLVGDNNHILVTAQERSQSYLDGETIQKIKNLFITRGFKLLNYYSPRSIFAIEKQGIIFVIYYYKNINPNMLNEIINDFNSLKTLLGADLIKGIIVTNNNLEKDLQQMLPEEFEVSKLPSVFSSGFLHT